MEVFVLIFFLVAIVLIPIMLMMWSNQKRQIGTIRCKRCNHVGPAKGL